MERISVVVPVYRNADSLRELHRRLVETLGASGVKEWEIVFVDDASPDSSFEILQAIGELDRSVKILRLSRNFGSNAALLAGMTHATGSAVCLVAADLQDPPEVLRELLGKWRTGFQVVIAARRRRDDPFFARLPAVVFNRLFKRFVFSEFPEAGFDFALLDRVVVDALIAMPEKNSYLFGQIFWLGFKRATVVYDRGRREFGTSAWTFARKVKYFIDAFTAFSYLPMRAAVAIGLLLATAGFIYATVVIYVRLTGGIPVQGFSALMVALLVVSGVQLVIVGVVGEYLWRVLEEVRSRPRFVVAERVNFDSQEGISG